MQDFFNQVTPGLGPLQGTLMGPVLAIVGVVWFFVIVWIFMQLVGSARDWFEAHQSRRPNELETAIRGTVIAGVALAVAIAAPLIAGVFLGLIG